MIDPFELDVVGRALDRKYYLTHYPDVADSDIDPVYHYCAAGWREGRNPSAAFETEFYLRANPDVAAATLNPFWHYLVAGRSEGRRPKDGRRSALRLRLDAAKAPSGAAYFSAQGPRLVAGAIKIDPTRPLIVSVSHDDYAANMGGVQVVIADEASAVGRECSYLHLSPGEPRATLADPHGFVFHVRLDGKKLGNASAEVIEDSLRPTTDRPVVWVIHHLMGHAPELLSKLIHVSSAKKVFFWAHDYFAACLNPNLLRNDVAFCGAPPAASQGCQICVYGGKRPDHQARIAGFISDTRSTVVAPSDTALELWTRFCGEPVAGVARPIAMLSLNGHTESYPAKERIRIAFLGMRQFHKGWHVFAETAAELVNDPRYEFVQLGHEYGDSSATGIPLVHVTVSAENRFGMVDAIARCGVDVVMAWSIWPETFNLTVHEAIAAGAFVIVRRDVGHPATATKRHAPEQSIDVASASELLEMFRSGKVIELVRQSRRRRGALVPMGGAADLLLAEARK